MYMNDEHFLSVEMDLVARIEEISAQGPSVMETVEDSDQAIEVDSYQEAHK